MSIKGTVIWVAQWDASGFAAYESLGSLMREIVDDDPKRLDRMDMGENYIVITDYVNAEKVTID